MTPSLLREATISLILIICIVLTVLGIVLTVMDLRSNLREISALKAENAALTLQVERAEAIRAKSDKAVARAVTRERQALALAAEKTRALEAAMAKEQEWRDTPLPPAVLEALR